MNPFDLLGVTPDADDKAVRDAYLEAVKRFPPEHCPDQFSAVSEAYQTIKDEESRLRYILFNTQSTVASPMEAVRQHFSRRRRRVPPDHQTLMQALQEYAAW
jgi:curved DNA-binding protein CbpA